MSNPTAKERLIDLINTTNPERVWLSNQLEFGVPQTINVGGFNTQIEATLAPEQPYVGSKILRYNRVEFDTISEIGSVVFNVPTQSVSWDLVPLIASRFNLPIVEEDIELEDLPPYDETGNVTYQMKASDESLLWTGSLTVVLTSAP